MISAEQLIALLEEKDLVPETVIASLRKQVAASGGSMSAASLAKRLVDGGMLTRLQAQRLLEKKADAPERPVERGKANPEQRPAPAAPREPEELELLEEGIPTLDEVSPEEIEDVTSVVPIEELDEEPPMGRAEEDTPSLAPLEEIEEAPRAAMPRQPKSPPISPAPPARKPQVPIKPAPAPAAQTPKQAPKPGPGAAAPKPPPIPEAAKRPATQPVSKQQPAPGSPGYGPRPAAPGLGGSLLDEEILAPGDAAPMANPLDRLMSGSAFDSRTMGSPLAAPATKRGFFGLFARKAKAPGAKEDLWDSPLLLIGGGTLLLMLILGLVLLWSITRQSGDEMFEIAEKDYQAGSYTQAIYKFDQYLQKFPTHSAVSTARVKRGLARLRQVTEGTSDWTRALQAAREVLEEIAPEAEFASQARPELASILPNIAQGLAAQAPKSPQAAELVKQAQEALELVAKYVPKDVQPVSKLADIEASLALTSRDISRDEELAKAVAGIQKALADGKGEEAYAIRRALIKQYPVLVDNAKLTDAAVAVAQAERARVKMTKKLVGPETTEAATPILATVFPVRRVNDNSIPDAKGQVVVAVHEGVAYGLDAATGKVIWRRAIGIDANGRSLGFPPTPVAPGAASDVLLVHASRNEVLRLEAATGRIRWRHALGERFDAHPVLTEDRLLVATRSGRLVIIDLESGKSAGYVQLPQELRVGPAVDQQQSTVYQVGEHSNLYILGLADGGCKHVVYLGHEPGSITVPPVVCSRFLIVAVNDAAEEATLRVFALPAKAGDPPVKLLQSLRVSGHLDMAPWVAENRILATTDRGEVHIFEIRGTDPKKPLAEVTQRKAAGEDNMVRFPLLISGQLWVADSQLTRYDFHASRGELQPKWVANEQSVSLQPLVAAGQCVIQVRRRTGLPGIVVSAVSMEEGQTIWETCLAAPLVVEPMIDAQTGRITAVTSIGAIYQFDASLLKADAFLDPPVAAIPLANAKSPVDCVVPLDNGLLAIASGRGKAKGYFLFNPRAENDKERLRMLSLVDPLGGKLMRFGNGLMAPTAAGQVLLLDPLSGRNALEPFQPRLESEGQIEWRDADLIGQTEIVLADGRSRLFRIGVKNQPKPNLALLAEATFARPIVSPVAVLEKTVYAVDAGGTLAAFPLPELSRGEKKWPLGGNCTWGPRRVGNRVMLATEDQLFCLDGGQKLLWKTPLPAGPLAGPPLEEGGNLLAAAASGLVWRINAATGKELARVETGRPLAGGPVLVSGQLIIGGHDGSLCRLKLP